MVYDDLAFCSCFVVTWASVCRRGLSSLPGGLLAGVGAGGELVDLSAGQDDAAAGAGDRADGELPAGNEVPQPRFAQAEQAGDLTDAVRQPLGGEGGGHAAPPGRRTRLSGLASRSCSAYGVSAHRPGSTSATSWCLRRSVRIHPPGWGS